MEPKDNDDPLTRADLAAAVAAVTVEARAAHDREARLSSAHEAEIRALENRHAERIGELQKMLREEEQRSTSRMVESLEHVHHVGQERALLRAALEHVLIVIDQPTNQESGSLAGEQLVDVARQIAHKALGTAPTEKM